jgi:sec-independent protein translocase protein TatA
MPSIGPMELVIVLVIALLVLGPKKLPEAGRGLGEGIRGFKNSLLGDEDGKKEAAVLPSETSPDGSLN